MARPVVYWDYLGLDRLLDCQSPPDVEATPAADGRLPSRALAHHDELLFIVVHQVFELWFKQMLHELRRARDLLGRPGEPPERRQVPESDIPEIASALGRVNEILRVCNEQWSVMETMPPTNFLAFRDKLIPASGFQSFQFRMLETLAGLATEERVSFDGKPYTARFDAERRAQIEAVGREMTLRQALFDWLGRTPIERAFPDFASAFLAAWDRYAGEQRALQLGNPFMPPEQRKVIEGRFEAEKQACRGFLQTGDASKDRVHAAFLFVASYRHEPLVRWPHTLIERLVEFEENLRIFRFRHVRMVERMIGLRLGTGGSPGVDYLDETARRYRIFGELLEARNFYLAASHLPPVPHPELLRFRFA